MALGTKLFLVLNGLPTVSRVGSTYSIGEKPTVILSTYIINHHAETPKQKQGTLLV